MRDIPMFTTEYGIASLSFQQIPYRQEAYVTIRDTQCPGEFVAECAQFCKAVGAERVYATGHPSLKSYPLYTAVWRMNAAREFLPQSDACLFPVTEQTLERWRTVYNQKMHNVANASYMSIAAAKDMLKQGSGYFVHRNGTLLGIGSFEDDRILSVASVCPGAGKDVVLALAGGMFSEQINLEVASSNEKAVRLYESLGFVKTEEVNCWYKII